MKLQRRALICFSDKIWLKTALKSMKGYLKLMDKHHFSFYAFIWLTYWRPLFSLEGSLSADAVKTGSSPRSHYIRFILRRFFCIKRLV